jgi:cobalt-zinc-cadmium efflux system outer membrane protein
MFIATLALATVCQAQAASASLAEPAFTVKSAADRARAHHPLLAASRAQIDVAAGRLEQAGKLPNPTFDFEWDNTPDFYEREAKFGFTQAFPITSRLRLERAVGTSMLRAAEAEVAAFERELLQGVRLAAVRCLASEETVRLTRDQLEHERDVATFIEAAAARGEASAIDTTTARLEVAELEIAIEKLIADQRRLRAALAAAMGFTEDSLPRVEGDLPPRVLPDTNRLSPEELPEYRAVLARIEVAESEIELAEAGRYEDVSAGLFGSVGREEDAPFGFEREHRIGFAVSIPLPLWNRNRRAIAEKTAEAFARRKDAEALAAKMIAAVRSLRTEADAALENIAAIEGTLLPIAERQTEQIETAHRAGLVSATETFRSHHRLLEIRIARAAALRDFHLARIQLEHALGITN